MIADFTNVLVAVVTGIGSLLTIICGFWYLDGSPPRGWTIAAGTACVLAAMAWSYQAGLLQNPFPLFGAFASLGFGTLWFVLALREDW